MVMNIRQAQISSPRESRVGNDFCAPNFARDRYSNPAAARSDTHSTPANSCVLAASTNVVRLEVRSNLPSRVRGVEQLIRAQSGARDHDRNSG